MDLQDLKKQFIREELGLILGYGTIFTFIDFGNVNKWYDDDRQDADNRVLPIGDSLAIDLEKMQEFLKLFSTDVRFYYGHEPQNMGSMSFLRKAKHIFGKSRVFTKPIQWVRHHVSDAEIGSTTRSLFNDGEGTYIRIPKCNFDVEISVDALKLFDRYDTFCLLSGDADFVYLNMYLRTKKKRVVLMKGGHITRQLRKSADLLVNAQDVKKHLVRIKQKPGG